MKRRLDLTNYMDGPPRKRLKTLHIRRKGYVPRYSTRAKCTAAMTIQKFWRFYRALLPSCQRFGETGTRNNIRRDGKDVICPITQDTIAVEDCFKFVSTSTGHVYAYSMEDLVNYFKTSGNFRCPLTREEFSRPVVRRLARKAVSRGVQCSNLTGMYEMRESIMNRTIERDNRLLAIENQCGIAMTECIDMCQNLNMSTTAAASELLNYLIPEWKALVDQYADFSRSDCIVMLRSDKDKMLRLMRSDLQDPHELVNFLNCALEEKIEQVGSGRPVAVRRRLFAPRFFSTAAELLQQDQERQFSQENERTALDVVENILGPLTVSLPSASLTDRDTLVQVFGHNENANQSFSASISEAIARLNWSITSLTNEQPSGALPGLPPSSGPNN